MFLILFFFVDYEGQMILDALKRYRNHIFFASQTIPENSNSPIPFIASCSIIIAATKDELSLDTDESYSLLVNSTDCELSSKTSVGALRGLVFFSSRTISQMWTGNIESIG